MAEFSQTCLYGLLQFCRLDELGLQLGEQAGHLDFKWFVIAFGFLCTNVAAGRKDVSVRGNLCGCC